jgi:hypothetical protein
VWTPCPRGPTVPLSPSPGSCWSRRFLLDNRVMPCESRGQSTRSRSISWVRWFRSTHRALPASIRAGAGRRSAARVRRHGASERPSLPAAQARLPGAAQRGLAPEDPYRYAEPSLSSSAASRRQGGDFQASIPHTLRNDLRSWKNSLRTSPHSRAITPAVIGTWWLSRGSETSRYRLAQAPALGSAAP